MRLIRQHINIPDVGSRVRVSKLCQLDVEEILKEVDSKKKVLRLPIQSIFQSLCLSLDGGCGQIEPHQSIDVCAIGVRSRGTGHAQSCASG
jgi:hypothetical protein